MSKPTTGGRARSKSGSRPSNPSGKRRSPSTESLPADWSTFIDCLVSHGVRFLVVGGHALAAHGRPRFTEDLDVLVEPTRANARRLGAALIDFGFPSLAREQEAFASPDRMASLGVKPLRIDIMTSISGVSFRQAWGGRLTARLGGHDVGVLGEKALRANKLASGRPKDIADLALLDEILGED